MEGSADVAELQFFTGTMDSGKSTLALQTNHNHAARGRVGRIFTSHDREGEAVLSSRLGLQQEAVEVTDGEVMLVGDVEVPAPDGPTDVAYEVLCRQHHRRRLTAARAKAVSLAPEPLPFG